MSSEQPKINDGGPAFPQLSLDAWNKPYVTGGMSLRDYLAGQAMQGFVEGNTALSRPIIDDTNYEFIACQSYEMADAMLKARQ